jgi:NAD(P)H-dependent flavin oxidoreductase YrpB (nitropropane dioxygenase family)
MPAVVTTSLACAVADAGAFPMIPSPGVPAALLARTLEEIAARTSAPFGVNFLMPFLDAEALDVASKHARLVEFFYGDPDGALVERAHSGGALVSWQVGSITEAVAAAEAGCDIVIAQGVEAGGHVRGQVGAFPLLAQVLDVVGVPVLAAGGIATAHSMAAALAAGASGVRVGTRFVAAAESGAHPSYVSALIAARAEDTMLTEEFSVLWPDAPHRVLRSCIDAARALDAEMSGQFEMNGMTIPVPRLSVYCPSRETSGHVEAMALYAGQSVDAVRRVEPAVDIVREICDGAEALLAREALR